LRTNSGGGPRRRQTTKDGEAVARRGGSRALYPKRSKGPKQKQLSSTWKTPLQRKEKEQ
jgi:hypothetical protein